MDKVSLGDTIRLDDTDDTVRFDDTNRLENYPDGSVVPIPLPLPPTSSDFARLVPVNDQARLAFHEIALILKADCSWNPHCRKFTYVSDVKGKVISGRSIESDTSEGDTETQEINTGYFRLNLTILPDNFPRGWVIGAGRPGLDHLGVDLLLTVKGNRTVYEDVTQISGIIMSPDFL